ncbi:unnamed protein product [Zymoseptoria tritici ST99CH_3D7]|uniref:Uncharacterized protein n=1 Tax=Zymoseptoria tritici (strain ST99CH_3D7) TaxID=1276538 RepID=A0A1X7RLZ6_ZYMT9|nr:unnamed protein product [Zymoseptoria tritici ST99CH_3D7]
MALSAQWDVGNSLFGAASGLRALASVLSKEEVHVQAVYAFESIGARLIVDDALHGEAVDALNGNESVRVAGMKLLIGLQSGGLVHALRGSPSCVRTFLLVAALKGCSYEPQEIADILHEIMVSTKLLSQVPVAARQLRSMIKAISGNAEGMLKSFVDRNMEVVTALAGSAVRCTQESWQKIPEKDMGKLLTNAFNAIQSDEFDCTELSGKTGLIRIASIMLWLNPDQTGVFSGEECVVGSKIGKLRIRRAKARSSERRPGWTVNNWKALRSSTSFIKGDAADEEFIVPHPSTNIIPLKATRQYYASIAVTAGHVDVFGGYAAALLDCIFDYGRLDRFEPSQPNHDALLHDAEQWDHMGAKDFVPLRSLWPSSFLSDLKESGGLWADLGWCPDAIEQPRLSMYQEMSTHIVNQQRLARQSVDPNDISHVANATYNSMGVYSKFISAMSKHWRVSRGKENVLQGEEKKMLQHIETLVASAMLLSQQRPIGDVAPYFNPATPGHWIWDALDSAGLLLSELAGLCLKASVNPSTMSFKPNRAIQSTDLIVATHGRVGFPYVLQAHSCLQEDALAVTVIAGTIRYNEHAYDVVLEMMPTEDTPASFQKLRQHAVATNPQLDQATAGASFDHLSSPCRLSANPNETKLTHLIATSETCLFLKTRLSSQPHPDRTPFSQLVSYKNTALRIAAAEHMNDESWHGIHNLDPSIPASFQEQIRIVECEYPVRDQVKAHEVNRVVTMIPHDQVQRFFAADPIFCGPAWARKLRVQHFMPIADCVRIMLEDKRGSKLITRGML